MPSKNGIIINNIKVFQIIFEFSRQIYKCNFGYFGHFGYFVYLDYFGYFSAKIQISPEITKKIENETF